MSGSTTGTEESTMVSQRKGEEVDKEGKIAIVECSQEDVDREGQRPEKSIA